MVVRAGVVQMSIENSIDKNRKKVEHYVQQAAFKDINLLAFPEMCLTGFNPDILRAAGWQEMVEGSIQSLVGLSGGSGVGMIIGHPLDEGGSLYNSATVILPDGMRDTYRKINLTREEEKYFSPGKDPLVFHFMDHCLGVIICRDQNSALLAREIRERGGDLLFILSAHYYDPREARWKIEKNRALPIARAVENGMYVFLANAVGGHISRISLGNSLIVDPNGAVVAGADEVSEGIVFCEI